MLRGQFLCFGLTLGARWTHQYDLRAQSNGCLALDRGDIPGHYDHCFQPQCPRGISHALRVIAAGVGNDTPTAFVLGKGRNLVVCAAQLERAYGLQIFCLEIEPAGIWNTIRFVNMRRDQISAHCDATQTSLRFPNILESDDGTSPLSS